MFAVPSHLSKVFQIDLIQSGIHNLKGRICCDCSCKKFEIKIFAQIDKDNLPHVCSYDSDYALVINAVCKDCRKEWCLFDMSKHGYNGYVCHDGVTVPNSELKEYVCTGCNEKYFEIDVGIELEDKQQFVEEIVKDDPDNFSEENYVDAFSWINIDIKCQSCGQQIKGWVDFETS